jgi:hypothetical protein
MKNGKTEKAVVEMKKIQLSGLILVGLLLLGFGSVPIFVPGLIRTVHAVMQESSKVALIPNKSGSYHGGSLPTMGFPGGFSPTFTNLDPATIRDAPIDPIVAGGYDTVVLVQFDYVQNWLSNPTFKSRIDNFVFNGGKLIIWDSENTHNDYSSFIYPFTANTPGALGAWSGDLWIVENNNLGTNNTASPSYVNTATLHDAYDIGDANVMVTRNPNWFTHMVAKNVYGVEGPVQTYARYEHGLIIYNGLDMDYMNDGQVIANDADGVHNLGYIWYLQLKQQWDPDILNGTIRTSGITVTPQASINSVGTTHTVTATVRNDLANPIQGVSVNFRIFSGPNAGQTGTDTTDASGQARFSWTSTNAGTDKINATAPSPTQPGVTVFDDKATKTWIVPSHDVAVTNVRPYKTVVGQGFSSRINVTVANQGTCTETFDVSLYANSSQGLVGYWKFDEGTGTKAYDSSGNGNNGALVNGPTWVDGKIGKALRFEQLDEYISIPDSNSIDIGTSNFTVAAWVYREDRSGFPYGAYAILSKTLLGSPPPGYFFGMLNNGSIYFELTRSPGGAANFVKGWSHVAVPLNEWHHVAITFQRNDDAAFYLDGNQVGSVNISNYQGDVANDRPLLIGDSETYSNQFKGNLDDVKIYDKALSAKETWTEYQRGLSGPIGYWSFDEGSGTTAYDSSGNNDNGAIYGATWTSGKFGEALSFDGIDDRVDLGQMSWIKGAREFSIEAWIKPRLQPAPYFDYVFQKTQTVTLNRNYLTWWNESGSWGTCGGGIVPDDIWTHIAGTWDGDNPTETIKFYVNGVLASTAASGGRLGDPAYDRPASFGGETIYGRYFNGTIDEVKIYDRALSAGEVWDEYSRATPVGYWKFDEGTGATAYDNSGNGNNGTLINGPTWVNGRCNKALSFDGVDDYVSCGNGASLNVTSSITVAAWVKFNALPSGLVVFASKDEGPGAQNHKWIFGYAQNYAGISNALAFHTMDPTSGVLAWHKSSVFSPAIGQWYHVAIVKSDASYTFYIDGANHGGDNTTYGIPSVSAPVEIGRAEGGFYFNGSMDEVKIYGRALSAAEIWAQYARTPIATQTLTLTGGASTIITFTWNTAGFAKGNYTISAYVTPVQGETDIADNTLSDGWIFVSIPGDINGDRKVELKDVYAVGKAYGSSIGNPRYEPNLDINDDGKIELKDYYITCKNYGKSW